MALNKQVHIYSVDTSAFYTDEEFELEHTRNKRKIECKLLIDAVKILERNQIILQDKDNQDYGKILKQTNNKLDKLYKSIMNTKKYYKEYEGYKYKQNKFLKDIEIITSEDVDRLEELQEKIIKLKKEDILYKEKLLALLKANKETRNLHPSMTEYKKSIISVFDSYLTRTLGASEDKVCADIIVVKVYYFQVLKNIIDNGYYYNGDKYICLTSSAGQIRCKKLVTIKESVWKEYESKLMCGLTLAKINEKGGMNVNKYLAYLALCNSATDVWEGFDINRSIVVDDFETMVSGIVDYIDDKTYEISRVNKEIPITHTDGCGLVSSSLCRKNMMVRLPWVKGLLASFNFKKFIKEHKDSNVIIKDIYGVNHNVIKEKIQVIFTKSQFKMWKFYSNWAEYQTYFNELKCTAGKCNEEDDEFENAKLNYQMLQTLIDITDEELETISQQTKANLKNICNDKNTMLQLFGATEENENKNGLQKSLMLYPELLNDPYTRQTVKDLKISLEKEAWSGKLNIEGKYLFLIPDLYAFCEYLFLTEKNKDGTFDYPQGLLKNGEVFCKVYANSNKLDCLRSPHLYREHAIRNNVIDDKKKKWFKTNAIYTSSYDLISKILQFDNDGDKSLVCSDETYIAVAERNMIDVVPLYYEMKKAKDTIITNDVIYNGLISAYTGGNIGVISNDITKIWNSEDLSDDAIKAIKLLCMENNFTIDYAKTLYKPVRPDKINELIRQYTKNKVPNFFISAKDKTVKTTEPINNSCVNKLHTIIPKQNIKFNFDKCGKFDYRVLLSNMKFTVNKVTIKNNKIINGYKKIIKNINYDIKNEDSENNYKYFYNEFKSQIFKLDSNPNFVINTLICYLFNINKSSKKRIFWGSFGDMIYKNIQNNLKVNYVQCEKCGSRFCKEADNQKICTKCSTYQPLETKTIKCCDCGKEIIVDARNMTKTRCDECQKIRNRELARIRKRKQRNKIN